MTGVAGEVPAAALLAQAARKSRVAWLSFEGPEGEVPELLVWHAWDGEALVVLADPATDERLADLPGARTATVAVRSRDHGGRLTDCRCTVEVVAPDDPAWPGTADALLSVRLNLVDPAAERERWRRAVPVVRLSPALP